MYWNMSGRARNAMIKYDVPLTLDENNNLHKLIKKIEPNSTVLEFGPSTGRLTKYMKEELGCMIYGVEIDEEAYDICKQYLIDGICGNLETYEWMDKFTGIQFDYIIFADVLEHLHNPKQVIEKIKPCLKEDGQILVSVPNIAHNGVILELIHNRFDYNQTGLLDNTHIHFFTASTCREMFEECRYHLSYSDGTASEPHNIELRQTYEGLPTAVRDYLSSREYGNLYQIIYAFQLKPCAYENLLDGCKTRLFYSKIYLDCGNGFCEEEVLLKKIQMENGLQSVKIMGYELPENIKRIGIAPLENAFARCQNMIVRKNNEIQKIEYDADPFCLEGYTYFNQEKIVLHISKEDTAGIEYVVQNISYETYLNAKDEKLKQNFKLQEIINHKKSIEISRLLELEKTQIINELKQESPSASFLDKIYHNKKRNKPNLKFSVINIHSHQVEFQHPKIDFEYFDGFIHDLKSDYVILCFNDAVISKKYFKNLVEVLSDTETDIIYTDCYDENKQPMYKTDYSYDYILQQLQEFDVLLVRTSIYNLLCSYFDITNIQHSYCFLLKLLMISERLTHVSKPLYQIKRKKLAYDDDIMKGVEESARFKYLQEFKGIDWISDHACNLRYHYAEQMPKITIVMPMKDKADLSDACINSILEKSTYKNYEILILDNNSEENETFQWFDKIKAYQNIKVIKAEFDFNWSKLNNLGIESSDSDVYIFLNNDTLLITPDWMERIAEDALRPDVGIVGGLLLYDDNTIQHAGVVLGMNDFADHIYKQETFAYSDTIFVSPFAKRNVMAVTGACMAVSKDTLDMIGTFNDTFIICGSDVEMCIRSYKKGLKNIYDPYVRLYHLESKSRDSYIPQIDFEMSIKHYAPYRIEGDPYFNENLSPKYTTPREKRES